VELENQTVELFVVLAFDSTGKEFFGND